MMMRAAHLGSMHAVDVIAKKARIDRHTLAGEMRVTPLFARLRLAERYSEADDGFRVIWPLAGPKHPYRWRGVANT
jgi:hypothetical protein